MTNQLIWPVLRGDFFLSVEPTPMERIINRVLCEELSASTLLLTHEGVAEILDTNKMRFRREHAK